MHDTTSARWILALLVAWLSASPAHAQDSAQQPAVKMSRTGICHERGSVHYMHTIYFEPFESMEACLAAGGRRIGEELEPGKSAPEYRGTRPPVSINWRMVFVVSCIAIPFLVAVIVPWYRRRRTRRAFRSFEDRRRRDWEGKKLERRGPRG